VIRGIPAYEYMNYRDEIAPFLRNFAQRSLGRWTFEGLEMDILKRDRQIWCIKDFQALGMTSVGIETVNIDACAGLRRHEWKEAFDDAIRAWAGQLGKKRIIALVRPGWSRWGKTRGYRETHREMVLEI